MIQGFGVPEAHLRSRHVVWQAPRRTFMQSIPPSGGPTGPTYAERLQQARIAKQMQGGAQSQAGRSIPDTTSSPRPVPMDSNPVDAQFSPLVQDALRTAITLLTARLQREQPMSRSEFDEFEEAVAIVVEDALPRQELPSSMPPAEPAPPELTLPTPPDVVPSVMSDDESEGPAWDPDNSGYGLSPGTKNTYTLDGMGAMTPEEYQEALRQTVIARAQEARRTGSYG